MRVLGALEPARHILYAGVLCHTHCIVYVCTSKTEGAFWRRRVERDAYAEWEELKAPEIEPDQKDIAAQLLKRVVGDR